MAEVGAVRRFLKAFLRVRCPLCREKTRHPAAHVWVNHFGEGNE